MAPRLHIPGLGGLSQGPGFANLGSLGLLANRVLQPLLAGTSAPERRIWRGAAAIRNPYRSSRFDAFATGVDVRLQKRSVARAGAGRVARLLASPCCPAAAPRRPAGATSSFTGSGYPGVDRANTRQVERPDRQLQRRRTGGRLEAAADGAEHLRRLLLVAGRSPRASIYSQDLESNVQAIDLEAGEVLWTKTYEEADQGPNGVVVAEGQGLRRHPERRLRARPEDRQGAVVDETGRATPPKAIDMAPGYHEGLVYVSTVPTNVNAAYPAAASARSGRSTPRPAKKVWHFDTAPKSLWGDHEAQRRRRPLVPALLRRKGRDVLRHRQPGAVPRHRAVPRGARAVPGRTSTPTRWSSSTRRPARWSGTTSRPRTTSTTGTSRTRRS